MVEGIFWLSTCSSESFKSNTSYSFLFHLHHCPVYFDPRRTKFQRCDAEKQYHCARGEDSHTIQFGKSNWKPVFAKHLEISRNLFEGKVLHLEKIIFIYGIKKLAVLFFTSNIFQLILSPNFWYSNFHKLTRNTILPCNIIWKYRWLASIFDNLHTLI